MVIFSKTPAYHILRTLAETPFDLKQASALTQERMRECTAYGSGLHLFYGTERVSKDTLEALFQLALEMDVVEKMKDMQGGKRINFSENRSALHTATRDIFSSKSIGPEKARKLAIAEIEKLSEFLKEINRENRFTDIVQIGIGGSCLGPKCISHALQYLGKGTRKIHFLSNVDPDAAASLLRQINPSTTLFIAVSKSGTTSETLTNVHFISEHLKKSGAVPRDHFVAVTEKGSAMDNSENYRNCFYIWDYIGGRYSVTSMVGAVIISCLVGEKIYLEFLRGAHSMDKVALMEDPSKNLPLLSALLNIWNRNFLKFPTKAILPYSEGLLYLPAHLQQCSMESNGKRVDSSGKIVSFSTAPIIWGDIGTDGQHSFYQFLHQGTDIVPTEFIGFKDSQYEIDMKFEGTTSQSKLIANLLAQVLALAVGKENSDANKEFPGNRPSRILFAKQLDPYTLGTILSYFEHAIAFEGFLWGINSFDQEGVQLGKVIATQILNHFSEQRPKTDKPLPGFVSSLIQCIEEV